MMDDWWFRLRDRMRHLFGSHENLEEELEEPREGSSSRGISTDYTELMGGSVPCPSCKGTGRIPKEMEETLVALIPLNDERLQPKRTWVWVLIGIGICTLLASIAIFMLVPRAVDLSTDSHAVYIIHVTEHVQTPAKISFNFMNYVNISNYNYYSVEVVNTTAQIISKFQPWSQEALGTGANTTAVTVSPLSYNNKRLYFNNSVTLTEVVAEYCQAPFSRLTALYVNMQFTVMVSLNYFNHREQITLITNQQVCCVPSGNCTST